MRTTRLIVVGLGNVGRRLLELIVGKRELLASRYDLRMVLAGAADTSGAAFSTLPEGLSSEEILALKRAHRGIAAYPQFGREEGAPLDLVAAAQGDVLVELSLTNLKDGEPGLSVIREAIGRGLHVVTANKGPLVLAYAELAALARAHGVQLLHSAAVTGGLPTLNLGRRDLGTAVIEEFEGVVNGTTNYILSRMMEGESYESALKHAQEIGMAEADPTLDVDGWDAANKLVIIANAVLRRPTTLADLTVEGIRGVTSGDLARAQENGQVIKLIARAEREGNDYWLTVKPTRLERTHPLASVGAGMMGVIYHTDINGTIFATIQEHDPYPTAAAVLRDIVNIYS